MPPQTLKEATHVAHKRLFMFIMWINTNSVLFRINLGTIKYCFPLGILKEALPRPIKRHFDVNHNTVCPLEICLSAET